MLFDKPAEKWEQYLPLGNGRLGCMVKAHPSNEILQLNEEGIWSGGPQNRLNPDVKNFYDFTVDDFTIENYVTGPQVKKIPIAI